MARIGGLEAARWRTSPLKVWGGEAGTKAYGVQVGREVRRRRRRAEARRRGEELEGIVGSFGLGLVGLGWGV